MENTVAAPSLQKWYSSPVHVHNGTLQEVRKFLPEFDRRTFGPALLKADSLQPDFFNAPGVSTGFNRYYDVIVRQPLGEGETEVPVGIVSPNYTLIQHHELLDEVLHAMEVEMIKPEEVKAELSLTDFGERMRLRVLFPDKFGFEVREGDRMGLKLECFNSVDGSMSFQAIVGWLRVVCSNGMTVGAADTYNRRHNQSMELKEIAAVLRAGITSTEHEREAYQDWMKRQVTPEKLAQWVNKDLAAKWGVKAAMRTWHITTFGHDVTSADRFEKGKPTEKTTLKGADVPGAVLPGDNVFAVSQALAWLAKERSDLQEQLERKQEIPDLVKPLLAA